MNEPLQSLIIRESKVTLLGTSHVSRSSADAVRELLRSGMFDVVCVELCQSRYNAIMNPDTLAEMDLFAVFRQRKASMVTAHLALGAYQQRMAEQLGVEPGVDMKTAIEEASESGLRLALIDREIGITLRRAYRNTSFWKRISLVAGLFASVLSRESVSEKEIEKLKNGDVLETLFARFSEESNHLYLPLVEERDQYMSAKILQVVAENKNKNILAVVGAGHMKGIAHYLKDSSFQPESVLERLETVKRKRTFLKILPWIIIVLIGTGFYFGFKQSPDLGWRLVLQWIVINGSLSALGAAIAGAHLITVVTAFIAAPITSLNPTIGAGMVTAAVETVIRKPTVNDFRALRVDTTTVKGWRRNAVAKTLLIFVLSSFGSAVGTYVAGFRIFGQLT
ncbi:MAG: TraB/GumN family protein [Gammaproteobacteria bacterium]|nr:TraB/GumN family protein [Gammaproteobacteria bacterium]